MSNYKGTDWTVYESEYDGSGSTLPVFAALMGIGLIAVIAFLLILAMGNPAPVEPLRWQSGACEPAIDLLIEAGDTTWHPLVLTPLPHLVAGMPYQERAVKVLSGRMKVIQPSTFCLQGITPLAGMSTRLLQSNGHVWTGIMVEGCVEARMTKESIFTILVSVPSNLDSDAIMVRNQF
jgi:hypothetical protein